ncbi:hypothetical protein [Halocatena pleomorpha]|nr:hypothetical protein [Halocatena pleomorpha]
MRTHSPLRVETTDWDRKTSLQNRVDPSRLDRNSTVAFRKGTR